MKNKKIAVIFAGQPRHFRHTFKSHLDFFNLDGYEFDFFIHAWNEQHYNVKTVKNSTLDNPFIENIDELKNDLIKIYNPKSIIVESQKGCKDLISDIKSLIYLMKSCKCHTKPDRFWGDPKNPMAALDRWLNGAHAGQVYSWQKATNLKIAYQEKNDIKYDGVIKFRLDNLLNFHHDNKKQAFIDSICNHERGGFVNRDKADEHRTRMKFSWQNKPNKDYWNVGDMMFGGPSHVFDKLMKDIYVFLIRNYCKIIGNLDGKWSHLGSSEGVLGKKLVFDEIGTGQINVSHFPYRDYHVDHPDQSYKALFTLRQQEDEGRVKYLEQKESNEVILSQHRKPKNPRNKDSE